MIRFGVLLFALAATMMAQTLQESIDAIVSDPGSPQALVGVHVRDLASGRTLYERNAALPMTPASNTKLFSSALALLKLGPTHQFETRVLADTQPDKEGVIRGGLDLVGGGDPSLSARSYPYRKGNSEGDPLKPLEEMAAQVAASGVKRIEGDIVGDDTVYPWEPLPGGWTVNDMVWGYGAPVSALVVNDNAIGLRVRPAAEPGGTAEVEFSPPVSWFTVANLLRSTAGGPRKIEVDRAPGSRVVVITGTAPAGSGVARETLAVDDPSLFAATIFRTLLEGKGITVTGEAVARHRLAGELFAPHGGMVLARRMSPQLIEILKVINKDSQNLHAELALLAAARASGRDASREESLALVKEWLTSLGVPEAQHAFQDGSGLTRRNLVSPATITTVLAAMHTSEHREAFRETLPVAGEDGTLANRFRGMKEVTPIRAKTGTISHVAALSGYAGDQPERRIAFSIMVNHAAGPSSETRAMIDKIAVAILRKGFE